LIRPKESASITAKRMPTIRRMVINAAPLAARMASAIKSLRLRM
jgi:hypothetical protein